MRRLGMVLAALAAVTTAGPARADTVIDLGVYGNAQVAGYCEDFSGRLPDGGPAVCRFPVPADPAPTIQALAMDATLQDVGAFLSFVMADGSTTDRLAFCNQHTFAVPPGARTALIQIATVLDAQAGTACGFGTAGLAGAIFDR